MTWAKKPDDYCYEINPNNADNIVAPEADKPVEGAASFAVKEPLHTLLYVDAGRWGGHSGENAKDYAPKDRNFVVICGNVVALCEFVMAYTGVATELHAVPYGTTDYDEEDEESDVEVHRINSLLHHLNKQTWEDEPTWPDHYSLGRVKVIQMARYRGPHPRPETRLVEVFLPDLHIPIIKPTEEQIEEILALQADPIQAHHPLVKALGKWPLWYNKEDEKSAKKWFERYDDADIFREAAEDLLTFLGLCSEWKQEQEADMAESEKPALRLVQVGDMLELWVGLLCCLEKDPEQKILLRSDGEDFINDCVGMARGTINPQSFYVDGEATGLATHGLNGTNSDALVTLDEFPDAVFCHGNHDNYLLEYSGGLKKRVPCYETIPDDGGRLRAEHGHAVTHGFFDVYNRDGANGYWDPGEYDISLDEMADIPSSPALILASPALAIAKAIFGDGKDIWYVYDECGGHGMTQFTFVKPIIRSGQALLDASGLLGGWKTFRNWGHCLAVYRWIRSGQKLAIFVQAHTHEAMIEEFTIEECTETEDEPTEEDWMEKWPYGDPGEPG